MKKKFALNQPLFVLLVLVFTMQVNTVSAFWVVNFGSAGTLPKGKIGFAAGLGGQMVFVGQPQKTNAFFMIPHAGFRFGLAKQIDCGIRLAPVPLPYSTVGPGFGMNFDVKFHLTKDEAKAQVALIAGIGGAHVLISGQHRAAWSPNAALLSSFVMKDKSYLTMMARYVYLSIPTAKDGMLNNFVHISGLSLGWKKSLTPAISILPEVGVYWYEGAIASARTSGPGFQYGIMVATSFDALRKKKKTAQQL